MKIENFQKKNKVHDFLLFAKRKVSVKYKKFVNFIYSCFSAAQIINSALLQRK